MGQALTTPRKLRRQKGELPRKQRTGSDKDAGTTHLRQRGRFLRQPEGAYLSHTSRAVRQYSQRAGLRAPAGGSPSSVPKGAAVNGSRVKDDFKVVTAAHCDGRKQK